jgi:diguanylate cyclase (GGDEF)-like protein
VRGAQRWAEHEPYFQRALEGKHGAVHAARQSLPQGPRWMRTSYVPDFDARGRCRPVHRDDRRARADRHAGEAEAPRRTRRAHRRAEPARDDGPHRGLRSSTRPLAPVGAVLRRPRRLQDVIDRLGHREGDALLVRWAPRCRCRVRAEDASAASAGDEFLVLAAVRDPEGAHTLALHMLAAVRAVSASATGLDTLPNVVSASIGYALARSDARHPLQLLQLADDAMYAAKRCGKNCARHCTAITVETTR